MTTTSAFAWHAVGCLDIGHDVFGFDKITYIVWFLLSEIWHLTEVLQKL
jgi:hypothetical protein